jgi:hypothetical protein
VLNDLARVITEQKLRRADLAQRPGVILVAAQNLTRGRFRIVGRARISLMTQSIMAANLRLTQTFRARQEVAAAGGAFPTRTLTNGQPPRGPTVSTRRCPRQDSNLRHTV